MRVLQRDMGSVQPGFIPIGGAVNLAATPPQKKTSHNAKFCAGLGGVVRECAGYGHRICKGEKDAASNDPPAPIEDTSAL